MYNFGMENSQAYLSAHQQNIERGLNMFIRIDGDTFRIGVHTQNRRSFDVQRQIYDQNMSESRRNSKQIEGISAEKKKKTPYDAGIIVMLEYSNTS